MRRALHSHGFFEVQSLTTPWLGLHALCGARSSFDYRSGYSFRDPDPTILEKMGASQVSRYGFPAIWYQARRTPTPGIEWTSTSDRLETALGY